FEVTCVIDSQCSDGNICNASIKGTACVSNTTKIDNKPTKNLSQIGCDEVIEFVRNLPQEFSVFVMIQPDLTVFSSGMHLLAELTDDNELSHSFDTIYMGLFSGTRIVTVNDPHTYNNIHIWKCRRFNLD
ncbi:17381_t:CDS:2, partial [Cetraspora pellucida]